MPKVFPQKVKDFAQGLYLEGQSAADISAAIKKKYKQHVGVSTIYQWVQANDWKNTRVVARADALTAIKETETQRYARIQEEHLDTYGRLRAKAQAELGTLTFDKAFDAAKAIDLGIKGERNVIGGLINLQFIQDIMAVLVEEISDTDMLGRIAFRLKALMNEDTSSDE